MSDASGPGAPLPRVPLVALAVVALVAPVLVGIGLLVGETWVPVLDHAQHELLVRDVGTADTPLVGPASTAGGSQGEVNHPGPIVFHLLAVPYRLAGSASVGLLVGAAVLNTAAMVGAVLVARRQGGDRFALLVALGLAVMVRSLGLDALFDEWNPVIALVPFVLLLVVSWAVACGRSMLLPLWALVASFLVQAHLSHALVVAAVSAVALAGTAVAWRDARPARAARLVAATVAVLAVVWAAPLVDQAVGRGNLADIVDYARSESRDTIGPGDAVAVVARELGAAPPWVGAPEATSGSPGVVADGSILLLVAPLVLTAWAVVVAWRRGDRDGLWSFAVLAAAVAAAIPTVASIEDEVVLHYVRWLWPVGLYWVLCLARVAVASPDRGPAWDRGLADVAVVACVGLLGAATVVQRPDRLWPAPPREAEIVAVVEGAVAAMEGEEGPVRVDNDGTLEGLKIQTALQLQLERAGIEVATPGDDASRRVLGDHRADRTPVLVLTVDTSGPTPTVTPS